jgi:penicillin-binding protein 2
MRLAIVTSSNVYFYSLANEMGVDLIHDQLEPFGFGRKTGIDLEGEVTGVLPSTDWKRAPTSARAAEVVPGRDHLAGHRPGLQQLHHAAAGHRHATSRPAASASSRAWCARSRTWCSPAAPVASDALPPLPLKPRTWPHAQRHGGRDAGGHGPRGLRRRYQSAGKTGTAQAVA